jgi:mxaJ protein
MCSRFLSLALAACLLVTAADARELRVCADPDNLPFSSEDGRGFENRIAEILAAQMHAELRYHWFLDRRGFLRKTLNARLCDVVIGLLADNERARTTSPYYRGTYVFVYRGDRLRTLSSLDDARLRTLRIGLAVVGDDMAATPPALALARRGIVDNVVGFPMFGDKPIGERLTQAVRDDAIDVAVLWGAQAGYFADKGEPSLSLTPIDPAEGVQSRFDIAVGVRKGDETLHRDIEQALDAARPAIDAVLDAYRVARVPP